MTLFVQNDAGSDGTGTVFPSQAEADLFLISDLDTKLGSEPLKSPADLLKVTYETRTQSGFPAERLFELVNTEFKEVPADPTDIIILAVDNSFTLSGGELITNIGGTSLAPKSSGEPGSAENPTESVLVIYDKEGFGSCELGLVSQKFDLASPSSVTLFHELSHAFRTATKTSLSLTEPSPGVASPEEEAAEKDENKMREQLKVALRDPKNHEGAPCGTKKEECCIVASITTGSQSIELNRLRQLREGFLRRSEVGYDFFERLHHDYYAFSPQVCREMGRNSELVENVATYYVRPLKECLELARAHLIDDVEGRALAERLACGIPADLSAVGPVELDRAVEMLRAQLSDPQRPALPSTPVIATESVYVRWALLETIEIYLLCVAEHMRGLPPGELGQRVAGRLDAWSARLPVTDVWGELSEYELAQELAFLGGCLLRSAAARREFAERLQARFPADDRLPSLLGTAGYPVGQALHG
jgi:hypothetical protein